jgi:hypothetical protein
MLYLILEKGELRRIIEKKNWEISGKFIKNRIKFTTIKSIKNKKIETGDEMINNNLIKQLI